MYRRVLNVRVRVLGVQHPDTIKAAASLAAFQRCVLMPRDCQQLTYLLYSVGNNKERCV